jgi:hypothetical protein
VPINQAVALHILKANLSDGAKVAALAGLVAGAATARDIATITNRSIRSVERHHAELRTWECAELRREKEKKYAEVRTSECADVRSHDHGEGSTNATGKADASPGAQASKACAA